MTITRFGLRSLPTYYKGITFRSRLEARWAIVFDQLGIRWEYEPEAFEIYRRSFTCDLVPLKFVYLPDFYLPDYDHYVEVKGNLSFGDYFKLLATVHQLSTPNSGRMWDIDNQDGRPLMVLGNLSNGNHYPKPVFLFNHKGLIYAFYDKESIHEFNQGLKRWGWDDNPWVVGSDSYSNPNHNEIDARRIQGHIKQICNNRTSFDLGSPWARAIDKARSTRFEDGRHV